MGQSQRYQAAVDGHVAAGAIGGDSLRRPRLIRRPESEYGKSPQTLGDSPGICLPPVSPVAGGFFVA